MGPSTSRNFTITGQCGIPTSAAAVSFNFAVWNTSTYGDFNIYPQGTIAPLVSTLNWGPGVLALANAAVVPLGSGGITIRNESPGTVDVFFDVNGYYSAAPADQSRSFLVTNSAGSATIQATNLSTTCTGACGVTATVSSGTAIYGTSSTSGDGVFGTSSDASGAGLHGTLSSNVSGSRAVYGEHTSTTGNGAGVEGVQSGSGTGVYGHTLGTASGGVGVLGYSASTTTSGYGVKGQAASTSAGFYGVYAVGNMGASGTKPFVEPHPTDASKVIRYVALEGPEAGTYFRGKATVSGGTAAIDVPESFRIVSDEEGLTVTVTPYGRAQVWLERVDLNQIVIGANRDVTVHYLVHGVRRAYIDWTAIADGTEFMPQSADDRLPAGLPDESKRRLIANGTYNTDGTVNMDTARKLGWTTIWDARDKEAHSTPGGSTPQARTAPAGQTVRGALSRLSPPGR